MNKLCYLLLLACASLAIPAYAEPKLEELQSEIDSLKATARTLQNALNADLVKGTATLTALQNQVNLIASNPALQLGPFVTVDLSPENGVRGPHVTFKGVNVHIVSGLPAPTAGLGNLIIGSDLQSENHPPFARTGTENLILGPYNGFTSSSSIIVGIDNTADGEGNFIAGYWNKVSGTTCSILGGTVNDMNSGDAETIIGGSESSEGVITSTLFPLQ